MARSAGSCARFLSTGQDVSVCRRYAPFRATVHMRYVPVEAVPMLSWAFARGRYKDGVHARGQMIRRGARIEGKPC